MAYVMDFVKNNTRVVAQVLLSLVALPSLLYSVWNTLSRATLNAFALVFVLHVHYCHSLAFHQSPEALSHSAAPIREWAEGARESGQAAGPG
jgi:hypothetical protein